MRRNGIETLVNRSFINAAGFLKQVTKLFLAAFFVTTALATAQETTRSIRISFVPPPLEGMVSLGIYDENDQLVRVLHQEAEFDEFTIGADALSTKWDGKDGDGYDLPAGRYHARGFVVAPMKIEEMPSNGNEAVAMAQFVKIKLVPNPLENNERPTVNLSVGFDDENAFLASADGLPLVTITPGADVTKAWLISDGKVVTVSLSSGTTIRQFSITGIAKMMAFDCGEFDLKGMRR